MLTRSPAGFTTRFETVTSLHANRPTFEVTDNTAPLALLWKKKVNNYKSARATRKLGREYTLSGDLPRQLVWSSNPPAATVPKITVILLPRVIGAISRRNGDNSACVSDAFG